MILFLFFVSMSLRYVVSLFWILKSIYMQSKCMFCESLNLCQIVCMPRKQINVPNHQMYLILTMCHLLRWLSTRSSTLSSSSSVSSSTRLVISVIRLVINSQHLVSLSFEMKSNYLVIILQFFRIVLTIMYACAMHCLHSRADKRWKFDFEIAEGQ